MTDGLSVTSEMRQSFSFLFYQQYLRVTQKLQLLPVQLLIPAVFIHELSQLPFVPEKSREADLDQAYHNTHALLEG